MSCFGQDSYKEPVVGDCDECGAQVDEDGDAVDNCCYSPVVCKKCNWQPCDESC